MILFLCLPCDETVTVLSRKLGVNLQHMGIDVIISVFEIRYSLA